MITGVKTPAQEFRDELKERIESEDLYLLAGNAADYVVYRQMCGRRNGLREALNLFDEIERRQQGRDGE